MPRHCEAFRSIMRNFMNRIIGRALSGRVTGKVSELPIIRSSAQTRDSTDEYLLRQILSYSVAIGGLAALTLPSDTNDSLNDRYQPSGHCWPQEFGAGGNGWDSDWDFREKQTQQELQILFSRQASDRLEREGKAEAQPFSSSTSRVTSRVVAVASGDNETLAKEEVLRAAEIQQHLASLSRRLVLIRHGQYVPAVHPKDRALTSIGRKQADLAGQRLAASGIEFRRMYVSDVPRARETGMIIQKHLSGVELELDALLREGYPSPPEPESAFFKPTLSKVYKDAPRIEAAFRKYFYRPSLLDEHMDLSTRGCSDSTPPAAPNGSAESLKNANRSRSHAIGASNTDLLVCHGNVIRHFVCRILQIDPRAWLRLRIYNCGITTVSIRADGQVSLESLGDVGHIPQNLLTYN